MKHLATLAESLLNLPAFARYSERAGVRGIERDLLRAYLAYCVDVLRPSEGLAATEELRKAMEPWRSKEQQKQSVLS